MNFYSFLENIIFLFINENDFSFVRIVLIFNRGFSIIKIFLFSFYIFETLFKKKFDQKIHFFIKKELNFKKNFLKFFI